MVNKRSYVHFFIIITAVYAHQTLFSSNSFSSSQQASLRVGNSLCQEEINYTETRLPIVKAALEKLLDMTLSDNEVPRIALCSSGGGCRAMIATLGSLQGFNINNSVCTKGLFTKMLESIINYFEPETTSIVPTVTQITSAVPSSFGLLDICTHAAALSGSTWALAGLIQSKKTVNDYLAHLSTALSSGLLSSISLDDLVSGLIKKYESGLPISLIDIWGDVIAKKVLATDAHNLNSILLSDQRALLDATRLPLPLYAAVTGNMDMPYYWVEFNPYEVGGPDLNAYIPTWAFGMQFHNGSGQKLLHPSSLSYALGIWGSAISANMKEFFEEEILPTSSAIIHYAFQTLLHHINDNYVDYALDHRISPAQVFNWTFGAEPPVGLSDVNYLTLVDAGVDFNLPIPLLITRDRGIDIIIILDASSGPLGGELRKAEQYAKDRDLAFPMINYEIINQTCSIHYDEHSTKAPVVIYMPLISNALYEDGWDPWKQSFTSTTNFDYTSAQISSLSGLTQQAMHESQEKILDALRQRILASRI